MQGRHRAGPLKQENKTHKTGSHKSKSQIRAESKGRVSKRHLNLKSACRRKVNQQLSRRERKHQLKQLRDNKKEQALAKKRAIGGIDSPPLLAAVISLQDQDENAHGKLGDTVVNCAEDILCTGGSLTESKGLHISIPRFKQRFHLLSPCARNLHAVLDSTKVADTVIFMLSAVEAAAHGEHFLDKKASALIAAVLSQGIPVDPVFVIMDLDKVAAKKQTDVKKSMLKYLNKWLRVEKLHLCNSSQEALLLLRHLSGQKRRRNNLRDCRSYLLAEEVSYEEKDGAMGELRVTGYVRNKILDVNHLVHLPGLGAFQLSQIDSASDPHPVDSKSRNNRTGETEMTDLEHKAIAVANPGLQESLVSENEPDMFDGEQFLSSDDLDMCGGSEMDGPFKKPSAKKVVRVPKGTSAYQAAWIMEEGDVEDGEDGDESDEESEEDEDMAPLSQEESDGEQDDRDEYETLTVSTTKDEDETYDEKNKVTFASEQKALQKLREARVDEMFPDEVDTPQNMLAKERFQKYRGLDSFRTSHWDPKESLPADYARIFQFENFQRTRKRIRNEDELADGAEPGWYVTLRLKDVPAHLYHSWASDVDKTNRPLVVYGMLPHENQMSVLNFVVKRHSLGHQDPIRSKERLLFHVGYRRFAACPIFSQHTSGSKHKYERFWRPDATVVMTVFAPITFPPSSVLVYQELANGQHSLVGTGSLISVDPDRLVIKRTVLSGHPIRVRKRKVVVRFMFFHREDIRFFKPVELRTKYGRRGHITEPLGTHGHMKCTFNGELSQQDTVLLNLYKRVFPKWNYDPYVEEPPASEVLMEMEGSEVLRLGSGENKAVKRRGILKVTQQQEAMDI